MRNILFVMLAIFSVCSYGGLPTITDPTSSGVTSTNATLGGNVTSDGGEIILQRGVVYSISSVNNNPQIGGAGVNYLAQYNLIDLSTAPSNMMSYSANIGQVYRMTLTGSTIGATVWGTGTYTNDSYLKMASVHAGILADGAAGTAYVQVTAGLSSYTGSTSNGVTSLSYGPWPKSYIFVSSGPTGIYSRAVTGLSPETTYSYAAYVTNSTGTSYSPVSTFTTLRPLPTVIGVSPNFGSTAGGTSIVISGANLTGATAITVGGNPCSNVTVTSATNATCVTPPRSAGSASVVVTTPSGTSVQNSLFTYLAPPTVSSVTPNSGSTAGGTSIVISGANLTGATAITVGGNACSSFNVTSATNATCVTPSGSAGNVSVVVTTPAGSSGPNSLFTYNIPPIVQFISSAIRAGQNLIFSISNGAIFRSISFRAIFRFGNRSVSSREALPRSVVPVCNISQTGVLSVVGGANISGYCDVEVTGTPLDGSPDISSTASIEISPTAVNSLPLVTSVTPSSGSTSGGSTVTITGSNLSAINSVYFGSISATSFSVVSSTQITAVVPPGTVGNVSLTVSDPDGGDATTYTYIATPRPKPIPTLSEWAQILMMLMMVITAGWYGRRQLR